MRKWNWQIALGIGLLLLSTLVYYAHYLIFDDLHHIFIYMIGDIAFVPVEVLMVTLILHQLLVRREKKATLQKMNMVIGAFFSEVGNGLLDIFIQYDVSIDAIRNDLQVRPSWNERDFKLVHQRLLKTIFTIDSKRRDLGELKLFLAEKRDFLLSLLENPILLEHEHFTDLLWAVFHLTEELNARDKTHGLPQADYDHLSGDIKRAYHSLISQWILYMAHLRTAYPYLFSLAVRTNPFNENRGAIIY